MTKRIAFFLFVLIIVSSFTKKIYHTYFDLPSGWPKPTYDLVKHPLSPAKVQLGRVLFYDPILSRDQTISCASCHAPYAAFAHTDHPLSHGIADQIGFRNAPALQNLAWAKHLMWDGAVHHLDAQALAPITNPKEMDETLPHVIEKLQKKERYKTLFTQAYGDSLVTGERVLKSISQFLLTLVSAQSKYDQVQQHKEGIAFTEAEKRGYDTFKTQCAQCHPEPLFTNQGFEKNGLLPDALLRDTGRQRVTHQPKDAYLFKVPSLRNVEVTAPYMHDGRFQNLPMVLHHYSTAFHRTAKNKNTPQKPLALTEQQKGDLIQFLYTLTDPTFLKNPDFAYPRAVLYPR